MTKTFFVISIIASAVMAGIAVTQTQSWVMICAFVFIAWMSGMCWLGLKKKEKTVVKLVTPLDKEPEEIILEAIRLKGKAKRHDLLPLVKVSKSTLVRILDKLEVEGKVVQVGERKASYYTLKS